MSESPTSNRAPSLRLAFGFFCLLFFATFCTILTTKYLYHDDWYVFVWDKSKWTGHPIFGMLAFQTGRPVGALFHFLSLYPINSIGDGCWVRALLVLLTAFSATFFFRIWRRLPHSGATDSWDLWLMTSIIFLSTPFQTYVGYISNGLDLFAVVLSLGSSYHILRVLEATNRRSRYFHFAAGTLLSLASFASYPPAAMFPWVFFAISFYQSGPSEWRQHWRYLKNTVIVFSTAAVAYRVYTMTIQTTYAHLTVTPNIFKKTLWYLSEPVAQFALNLWGLTPSALVSCLLGFTIFVGMLCPGQKPTLKDLRFQIPRLLLLPLFYVLACLPMIVSAGAGYAFRSSPGLYALTGALLFIALKRLASVFKLPLWTLRAFFFVLLSVSIYQASYNTGYLLAENISREYQYISNTLKQVNLDDYRRIHIIKPDISKGFVSFVSHRTWGDEFAVALTNHPQDICPMMISIFKDLGIAKESYQDLGWDGMQFNKWHVSFGTSDQPREFQEPTLQIDMQRFRGFN